MRPQVKIFCSGPISTWLPIVIGPELTRPKEIRARPTEHWPEYFLTRPEAHFFDQKKIGKFGIFRGNFPSPNLNQRWLIRTNTFDPNPSLVTKEPQQKSSLPWQKKGPSSTWLNSGLCPWPQKRLSSQKIAGWTLCVQHFWRTRCFTFLICLSPCQLWRLSRGKAATSQEEKKNRLWDFQS